MKTVTRSVLVTEGLEFVSNIEIGPDGPIIETRAHGYTPDQRRVLINDAGYGLVGLKTSPDVAKFLSLAKTEDAGNKPEEENHAGY